jgi:AraC-like DNA-binding protein
VNPIDFIDVLLILGISQGLLLSFVFLRLDEANASANIVLSIILLMSCFMLTGRFIYSRVSADWVRHWSVLPDSVIFLFGPLSTLYVRRLLIQDEKPFYLPLIHFVPATVHLLVFFYLIVGYTDGEYLDALWRGDFAVLFFIIEITAIALNFCYCVWNFQIIRSFKKEENELFSYPPRLVQYVGYFQYSILISITLWALAFITRNFILDSPIFIDYNIVWVAIPLFIYLIAYFTLRQPDLFRVWIKTKSPENRERVNAEETIRIQAMLEGLMNRDKVYLDKEVNLSVLAEKVKTSPNNLSWLLNNVYQTNFYDYINRFRVEEFIKRLNNKEHVNRTLLAIAYDSGFKSKSTFNKAFKHELNKTPREYVKGLNLLR